MAGLPIFEMRGCQALFFEGNEPDFSAHALRRHFIDALEFPVNAHTQLEGIGGVQEFLKRLNLLWIGLFAF
jgi:hypothetical protein